MRYLVRWEIDIEAETPEQAAAEALRIQRNNDPGNLATMFEVCEVTSDWEAENPPARWKLVDAVPAVGQEQDCMRCEETFVSEQVSEFCPKCVANMNRMDMR